MELAPAVDGLTDCECECECECDRDCCTLLGSGVKVDDEERDRCRDDDALAVFGRRRLEIWDDVCAPFVFLDVISITILIFR